MDKASTYGRIMKLKLRENRILFSLLLLASAFFLLINFAVGDDNLFILINLGISNPILDFICEYGSILLFSIFFLASLIVLYISKGDEFAGGLIAILSGPLSYFLGSILKAVIQRPRPFELFPARTIGIWHTSTFSFPSTTTMLVFGFALPVFFEKPRLGFSLIVLAALIGFSVVYMGFHYPSDVIAGTIFSTAITLLTYRLKPYVARLLTKCGLS